MDGSCSFPGMSRDFSLFRHVLIGPEFHPASCLMDTGDSTDNKAGGA
jgi:hypothetical protein